MARQALAAMHGQVGTLVVDKRGVARRGVILRHLVMPGGIEETRAILKHVATTLSPDTYVNLMPQYRPCGEARHYNELNRRLTVAEFESAVLAAMEAGLRRLD